MMTYGFISALFLVFNTHKYVIRNEKSTNCIRQAKLIIILFPDIIYN